MYSKSTEKKFVDQFKVGLLLRYLSEKTEKNHKIQSEKPVSKIECESLDGEF